MEFTDAAIREISRVAEEVSLALPQTFPQLNSVPSMFLDACMLINHSEMSVRDGARSIAGHEALIQVAAVAWCTSSQCVTSLLLCVLTNCLSGCTHNWHHRSHLWVATTEPVSTLHNGRTKYQHDNTCLSFSMLYASSTASTWRGCYLPVAGEHIC